MPQEMDRQRRQKYGPLECNVDIELEIHHEQEHENISPDAMFRLFVGHDIISPLFACRVVTLEMHIGNSLLVYLGMVTRQSLKVCCR